MPNATKSLSFFKSTKQKQDRQKQLQQRKQISINNFNHHLLRQNILQVERMMNSVTFNTSPSKEYQQTQIKQDPFIDFLNATNEIKSPTVFQESPTLHFKRRQSSYKPNLNLLKSINNGRNQKVSIQQICPKTEGNEDEEDYEEYDNFEIKSDQLKTIIENRRIRDKNKKLSVAFAQNEDNKINKPYSFQRQFSMNVNSFQKSYQDQKQGLFNSNLTKSIRKQGENHLNNTSHFGQNQAKENFRRIIRKEILLNNTVKLFTQILGARYIQRKTESLFGDKYTQKIDLQKSKYFDDLLFNKGLFSKEYINPQNEFLKALLNLPIELQNPIHGDIAINILKKKLKSPLEIQYLSRCLMTLELFQQNSNILEDQASLKIIISEINHVFFPKNSIIFNFGKHCCIKLFNLILRLFQNQQVSTVHITMLCQKVIKLQFLIDYLYSYKYKGKVYCFIPRPDKKDKLLYDQVEIERQAIKTKNQIPLVSTPLINSNIQSYNNTPKSNRKFSIPCISSKQIDSQMTFTEKSIHIPVQKASTRSILSADRQDTKQSQQNRQQSRFQNLKNDESYFDDSIESDVSVLDQQQEDNENQVSLKQIMKQAFQSKKQDIQKSKRIFESSDSLNEDIIFQQTYFPEMNLVKIYQPGEAFGEIALMTKERRTASLVCKEDSHLMVLSKEGFEKILGSYQKSIIRQKVTFLKSFSFFESIANSQLMSLLHYFDIRQFPAKAIIYQENDPANEVYFIKQGEVEIQKQIYFESNLQTQLSQEMNSIQESQANLLFNKSIQAKGKQQQKKIISIKIVGPIQYFGQDEILSQEQKRLFRAIALQESQIYIIQKKDLFSFLKQHKQIDLFRDQMNVKQQWQKAREEEATQLASLKEAQSKSQVNSEMNTPNNKQFQQQFSLDPYIENLKKSKIERFTKQINNIYQQQQPTISSSSNSQFFQQKTSLQINHIQDHQQKDKSLLNQTSQLSQMSINNNFQNHNEIKEQPSQKSILNDNLNKQISFTNKKRVLKSLDFKNIQTQEDEAEEDHRSSLTNLKKKAVQPQQQYIIPGKKKNFEKISNIQSSERYSTDKPNTHYIQLMQLQKINEQNQEIMKEIYKQRTSTTSAERQSMDNCTKGYGFDLYIDQGSKSNKTEHKSFNFKQKLSQQDQLCNSTARSDKRNWKSFDRNTETQDSSSHLSNYNNNKASKVKQNEKIMQKLPNLRPLQIDRKSFDLKSKNEQLSINKDNHYRKSSEQLSSKNDTQGSYLIVEQLQSYNNKSLDLNKYKQPKSLNLSNSSILNELGSKSLENSPLIRYYDKSDDIKEDFSLTKKDEQFSITSLGQQVQKQVLGKQMKKQNFISQFFQNNEVIKNKSIQKILKQQQNSHYLFKQLYATPNKFQENNNNNNSQTNKTVQ